MCDSATNQVILVLAQKNMNLTQENIALKKEIAVMKDSILKLMQSEPKNNPQCCGKTGKGNNCQMESKTRIGGQWYCWRHHRRLMETTTKFIDENTIF